VHVLEHFSCKRTVQQHRNTTVTLKANFANKYLDLVLYSLPFQSTIRRDSSLMCWSISWSLQQWQVTFWEERSGPLQRWFKLVAK